MLKRTAAAALAALVLVLPATAGARARDHRITFCYTITVVVDLGKVDLELPVTICERVKGLGLHDGEPWQL